VQLASNLYTRTALTASSFAAIFCISDQPNNQSTKICASFYFYFLAF